MLKVMSATLIMTAIQGNLVSFSVMGHWTMAPVMGRGYTNALDHNLGDTRIDSNY